MAMCRELLSSSSSSASDDEANERKIELEKHLCYKQELAAIRTVDGKYHEDVIDCMVGFRRLRQRVGSLTSWPREVLRLFRRSDLNFKDRMDLSVFALVNDLDMLTFLSSLQYLSPLKRNPAAAMILRKVRNYFVKHPKRGIGFSAFNVKMKKIELLTDALRRRAPHGAEYVDVKDEPYPDYIGIIPEIGYYKKARPTHPYNTLEVLRQRARQREVRAYQARNKALEEDVLDLKRRAETEVKLAIGQVEKMLVELLEKQLKAMAFGRNRRNSTRDTSDKSEGE